jgi:hypothetical protein
MMRMLELVLYMYLQLFIWDVAYSFVCGCLACSCWGVSLVFCSSAIIAFSCGWKNPLSQIVQCDRMLKYNIIYLPLAFHGLLGFFNAEVTACRMRWKDESRWESVKFVNYIKAISEQWVLWNRCWSWNVQYNLRDFRWKATIHIVTCSGFRD